MIESRRPSAFGHPLFRPRSLLILVYGLGLGIFAALVAALGFKWQFVLAGSVILGAAAAASRDRRLFFLVVLFMSVPIELKKSFSDSEFIMAGAIGFYYTTVEAILVVLYVLWIREADFWARARRAFFSTPNLIALLVLAGAVPSFVNSEAVHLSFWELNRMLCAYALFFYAMNSFRRAEYARYIIGAMMASAVIQSIIGTLQGVFQRPLGLQVLGEESGLFSNNYAGIEVVRVTGTLFEPNSFAFLMTIFAVTAVSVCIFERRLVVRLVSAMVCAGSAFATVATLSRSGAVAFIVSLSIVLAIGIAKKRISLIAVLGIVVVTAVIGLIAWIPIADRVSAKLRTQSFEVDARLQLNWIAVDMILDNPIVGVGLNNFSTSQLRYEPPDTIMSGASVHNLYLLTLAETGLIGFLPMLAYIYIVYRTALPLIHSPDSAVAALATGVLAGLAGMLIGETTFFALKFDVLMKFFWLSTGILISMRCQQAGWFDQPARSRT